MTSIKEAFNKKGSGPYGSMIKVKVVSRGEVVTYRGPTGEPRKSLALAVSDGTDCILAKVYDASKFAKCQVAATLSLRDTIRKIDDDRHLVITKNTRVFITAGIEVPLQHTAMGDALVNPPAAATVPLDKALQSPQKTKVSVSGKIVQEEAVRTVKVREDDVDIKVITLEADSQKAKVTLWRDSVKSEVRPGDFVTITDVVTNHFKGETSLSTTNRSTLKITEPPTVNETIEVVGVDLGEDGTVKLLLVDDSLLSVTTELLLQGIPNLTDVETLTLEGSVSLEIERKGSEVVTIAEV